MQTQKPELKVVETPESEKAKNKILIDTVGEILDALKVYAATVREIADRKSQETGAPEGVHTLTLEFAALTPLATMIVSNSSSFVKNDPVTAAMRGALSDAQMHQASIEVHASRLLEKLPTTCYYVLKSTTGIDLLTDHIKKQKAQ